MNHEPKISILTPFPPGKNCEKMLASLEALDYPLEKMEVVVVEGRQPSQQRNRGVEAAGGDIIYFLDDDCELTPDLFRKVMKHYEDESVKAVAGVAMAREGSPAVSIASHMVLGSVFGGCTIRVKYKPVGGLRPANDKHFILCNASIRRDVYLAEGGLREDLYPGEENEFFRRLHAKGHKMLYDPQAIVHRNWRNTIGGFIKAIFNYGRAKVDQGFEHYEPLDYLFFIPLLFLFYLLALPLLPAGPLWSPFWLYLALLAAFSAYEVASSGSRAALLTFLLFPLLHLTFAVGIIWGFMRSMKPRYGKVDVKVRVLKAFGEKSLSCPPPDA